MGPNQPFHIVVAEAFDTQAVARLEGIGRVQVLTDSSPQALLAAVSEADALLVRSKAHVTARIIEAAPRLKVIGRAGPTVDHIDLRAAGRRKIPVVYTPHMAVTSIAEFALALILTLHRRILQYNRQIREGQFEALRTPAGHELASATVGLVGLDPVAERLGRILSTAFGSTIVYHDPAGKTAVEFSGESVDVDTLLARADVLTVHLQLTPETRGWLSAQRLGQLKASAIVVNVSRGGVIDTTALADALQARRLAGAGLDVFEVEPLPADHPIRRAANCILTPHVAAATLDATSGRYHVADDVIRVLSGLAPKFPARVPG